MMWQSSSLTKSDSEDSTLLPTTLGEVLIICFSDRWVPWVVTMQTSTQSNSEHWKTHHMALCLPQSLVGVFLYSHIILHPLLGLYNPGSEQLPFWERTKIWCPGVTGVVEGRGWNFSILDSGWRALPCSRPTQRRRGIALCHSVIRVNTIWWNNDNDNNLEPLIV